MDMVRYQYGEENPTAQSLFFFQSFPYILTSFETIICFSTSSNNQDSELKHSNKQSLQSLFNIWSFSVPVDYGINLQPKGSKLNTLSLRSPYTVIPFLTAFDLNSEIGISTDQDDIDNNNWLLPSEFTDIFDISDRSKKKHYSISNNTNTTPQQKESNHQTDALHQYKPSALESLISETFNGFSPTTNQQYKNDQYENEDNDTLGLTSERKRKAPSTFTSMIENVMHGTSASKINTNNSNYLINFEKGQIMNELCEKFYQKYPFEGVKWPDKPSHFRLIDFLNDEKLHNIENVSEFAVSMRLARSVEDYELSMLQR